jgi:hypothetical protein
MTFGQAFLNSGDAPPRLPTMQLVFLTPSRLTPSLKDSLRSTSDLARCFRLVDQASDCQRPSRSQSRDTRTSRTEFPPCRPSPKPSSLCRQVIGRLIRVPSPSCSLVLMVPVRRGSFAPLLTPIRALPHVLTLSPCHFLSYACNSSCFYRVS